MLVYNHTRSVHFGSYARGWVRQGILYWIKEQSGVIKLPAVVWQTHSKIEYMRSRHFAKTGRDELPEELAANTGRVQMVEESIRSGHVGSIHERVHAEEDTTLEGSIGDTAAEFAAADQEMVDRLYSAAASMPSYARRLLFLHYGLLDRLVDKFEVTDRMLQEERLKQFA